VTLPRNDLETNLRPSGDRETQVCLAAALLQPIRLKKMKEAAAASASFHSEAT
jgi:hypothetical protein